MKPFLIVSFLIVAASMLESRVNGQYCTAQASTIDSSNNRHLILIVLLTIIIFLLITKQRHVAETTK